MNVALFLYLQLAVVLGVALGGWHLLRRFAFERRGGASAAVACRIGQGLLLCALVAPLAGLLLPVLPLGKSGAAGRAAVAQEAATVEAADSTGFTLLGRRHGPLLEGWHVRALLILVLLVAVPAAAIALLRTGAQLAWLRRVLRSGRTLRRLGGVRIVVSDQASTPFSTVAFGLAHVVVPTELVASPEDLSVVLRHELHHHRRGDTRWALLAEVLHAAFSWNPAARGWARELAEWQERACDEELVRRGQPLKPYVLCLLRVAERSLPTNLPLAATAMARPRGRATLLRRIEMLVDAPTRTHRLSGVSRLITLAVAAAITCTAWLASAVRPAQSSEVSGATSANGSAAAALAAPSAPALNAGPAIGSPAPDVEFTTSMGESVRLSDLRGQVVVIAFWAEWCRFCHAAVPQLKQLNEALDGEDFRILGVAMDTDPEAFARFVKDNGIGWAQHRPTQGWKGGAALDYGITALPYHVVIDRQGRISARAVTLAELGEAIDDALGQ